ncbi:gliding motility-associated C-terminal domain-containing protein, partial [Flavobacteriales bacterium]|nr:gliding motility-associated C-terminal domain-containing protein [Flavobacteriales bacterium]
DLFAINQNSSNATNDTAIALYAGTWQLTVEDVNGCKDSLEIEVLQPEVLAIGSMIMDSVSCYGGLDGTAKAVGITGGNGTNSFSWNTTPVQTTNPATALSAGTYTVTVTDQKNCSTTGDTEVKEPNAITIDSIFQDSVRCYGLADGVAVVSNISGGTGSGYNFTWTDALGNNLFQDSSSAINLSAGFYNIRITDSDACYLDTNVIVLEPNLLVLDTSTQDSVSCSGTNDGSAYVAVSGGNGVYDYLWSNGQNSDTASNIIAGLYNVTIADQMLCSLDTSVMVLEPAPLIVDTISQDSVLCNSSSGGSAYVGVIGGNGIYDYSWSNGQTSDTVSNITAGIYQVTITDQLLCSLDTSVTVLEPDTFVVDTLNVISPYCSSSTDAIINLVVTGGNSPYGFSWSDNSGTFTSNNQNINNLLPGTYYVLVTDNNGCIANDTVTLTPGLEIFANAGPEDTLVCFEDSLTLLGTTFGAINPSVSWNLLRNVLSTDSTISYYFDDSATVIYDFVFVVTEQNCIVKDSIKVIVAPLPILDAGNDAAIETGLAFTLGGSPTGPINSSYFWTPLINFYNEADSVTPNPEIEVNSTQAYIVFVTDTNGCKNNDTIKVELVPNIEIPSAFSPNNDGINDRWIIEISELYTNVTLRVYNRWGILVYNNLNNVVGDYWTGNGKNSKPLTVGTYYFVMEYDGIDGEKNNITGPITIIR